jgi:hypothetical protein
MFLLGVENHNSVAVVRHGEKPKKERSKEEERMKESVI